MGNGNLLCQVVIVSIYRKKHLRGVDMSLIEELRQVQKEKQEIQLNKEIDDRLFKFDALLCRLEVIVNVLEEKFLK